MAGIGKKRKVVRPSEKPHGARSLTFASGQFCIFTDTKPPGVGAAPVGSWTTVCFDWKTLEAEQSGKKLTGSQIPG